MRKFAFFWSLLKQTFVEWNRDGVPRLGAALAYYTVFSIVPLLVVIIAVVGMVFGQEAAQDYIIAQIEGLVGTQSASAIQEMLELANRPSTGVLAAIVGIATLLLGASGVFGQLQDSLNTIWDVEPKEGKGLLGLIKDRFISFLAVLGTGFLLTVSLILSAWLAAFGKLFEAWLPLPEILLEGLNFSMSFVAITVLFAMIFKVLPDAKIAWKDVWVGAAMTSLLFTLGKFALGLYLGKSDIGTAYGAAGSLVIVLVWVYYSSQILLFGAEFTFVYADQIGSRIIAQEHEGLASQRVAFKRPSPAFSHSESAPGRMAIPGWIPTALVFVMVTMRLIHRPSR